MPACVLRVYQSEAGQIRRETLKFEIVFGVLIMALEGTY